MRIGTCADAIPSACWWLEEIAAFCDSLGGTSRDSAQGESVGECLEMPLEDVGIVIQRRASFVRSVAIPQARPFARSRGAIKRGGQAHWLEALDPDAVPAPNSYRSAELIALDEALTVLAQLDARRARVVELHVFGGLTMEEAAEVLGLSPQSVRRDWKLAKAWLLRALQRSSSPGL
jgi:RNA polymerase sigma factor (sigma-70 family)